MNIAMHRPWALMNRLNQELDQAFGDSWARPAAGTAAWAPSVDIREEAERFIVHADLPGVAPEQISITADHGVLTLRGDRKFEKRDSSKGFERLERIEGSFLRRFSLPENVRTDEIRAKQTNGVLEIVIPKQAAAEPRRVAVEAA